MMIKRMCISKCEIWSDRILDNLCFSSVIYIYMICVRAFWTVTESEEMKFKIMKTDYKVQGVCFFERI